MNKALKQFGGGGGENVEDIVSSIVEVRDHLSLLSGAFHHFDASDYFTGEPVNQLNCLNLAAEQTSVIKYIFIWLYALSFISLPAVQHQTLPR